MLGQNQVAAKSNESPAVQDLLAGFDPDDLHGCVITADAMHTQDDTAATILAAGADYVFTVKANRPTLLTALKALPWTKGIADYVGVRRAGPQRSWEGALRRTRRPWALSFYPVPGHIGRFRAG